MSERPVKAPGPRRLPNALLAGLAGTVVALSLFAWWRLRPPAAPRATAAPSAPVAPSSSAPVVQDDGGARDASADPAYADVHSTTLEEQKAVLLANIASVHELTPEQVTAIRTLFEGSRWLGQGFPKVTEHPMSRSECRRIRSESTKPIVAGDPRCGSRYMVPLYDPARGETAERAKLCIDQYEFPNIPCEYPVVYAKANEAAALCKAVGKRLCDAHEWEGGCAGALKSPDEEYAWGQRRMMMEYLHNKEREIVWAYGKEKDHSKCATASRKSRGCVASGIECGSNTYPTGAFPECVSSFGVYDQHGNAAEHMNLPLKPEQLGSRGGSGETEMKGSWFIFLKNEAHEDDCRWRALMWHKTRVTDEESHRNYHLGFRCCRDL